MGDTVGVELGEATALDEAQGLGTGERLADAVGLAVALVELAPQPVTAICIARATVATASPLPGPSRLSCLATLCSLYASALVQ